MKERPPFRVRPDLPPMLNIVRVWRRLRSICHSVRPVGKMERRIRNRAAFRKPGGRRSIIKRLGTGA